MKKVLLVAVVPEGELPIVVSTGVSVGMQCGQEVTVLIFGSESSAKKAAEIKGVSHVFYSDEKALMQGLAEPCAAAIARLGKDQDVVLMAANTTGKNILPRVSGLLRRGMLSDVILIREDTVVRPIYAGNALETVRPEGAYLMSFRPTSFTPITEKQSACAVVKIEETALSKHSEWIGLVSHAKDRPDLSTAKYVVSGGRGLKSKAQFQLIEHLADCLGAAVGASRAAVDAGFVPNDCQVGQTGKIVAPTLYIAIGISGAIQHLAGMKSAKVIVAINQDPEAPIFKVADYGWVVDLFEAIPALEKALTKPQ